MSPVLSISPVSAMGAASDAALLEVPVEEGPKVELHVITSPSARHLQWMDEFAQAGKKLQNRRIRVTQRTLAVQMGRDPTVIGHRFKTLTSIDLWPANVPKRTPGCNKNSREILSELCQLKKRIEATIGVLIDGGLEVNRDALADRLEISTSGFAKQLSKLRRRGLWPEGLSWRATTPEGIAANERSALAKWQEKFEAEARKLSSGKSCEPFHFG